MTLQQTQITRLSEADLRALEEVTKARREQCADARQHARQRLEMARLKMQSEDDYKEKLESQATLSQQIADAWSERSRIEERRADYLNKASKLNIIAWLFKLARRRKLRRHDEFSQELRAMLDATAKWLVERDENLPFHEFVTVAGQRHAAALDAHLQCVREIERRTMVRIGTMLADIDIINERRLIEMVATLGEISKASRSRVDGSAAGRADLAQHYAARDAAAVLKTEMQNRRAAAAAALVQIETSDGTDGNGQSDKPPTDRVRGK